MFIVLPNQLYYDSSELQPPVYLIEEPLFFYDAKLRPIKPSKIKLTYMVACMYEYKNYLDKKGINVTYVKYSDVKTFYEFLKNWKGNVYMYDSMDKDLESKFMNLKKDIIILDSPGFLLSKKDIEKFHGNRHSTFYKFIRNKLGVLEGVKNYDNENRKSLPKKIHYKSFIKRYKNENYVKAASYIDGHSIFSAAVGSTEYVNIWPITYMDALNHMNKFINDRLDSFGVYQDAMDKNECFLFHSALSPMINIGILRPSLILERVMSKVFKYSDLTILRFTAEGALTARGQGPPALWTDGVSPIQWILVRIFKQP